MDLSIFKKARPFFDFSNRKVPQSGLFNACYAFIKDTDFIVFHDIIATLCNDLSTEWDIDFSDLSGESYAIDDVGKTITLDTDGHYPNAATIKIVLALVEGLRMARHYEWLDNGVTRYHPETILKIGRICVADAMTQTISSAWHARARGYDSAWKYCLAGQYSDMAACYARVMDRCETQNINEDQAITEAQSLTFRTWFTDEDRVGLSDAQTLDWMDDLLSQDMHFGVKRLDTGTIVCFALQMGGRACYLNKKTVRDIMTNPFYGAIESTIHQAYLMQIIRDNQTEIIDGIPFRDASLAARFGNPDFFDNRQD